VLFADKTRTIVHERGWVGLIQCIAAGDERALLALYEQTHEIVFTLASRLLDDPEAAGEVTLDVAHEVWWRAAGYEAEQNSAGGSVVAWIMNLTRSRALAMLRLAPPKMRRIRQTDTDILQPPASLWGRLARHIDLETDRDPVEGPPQYSGGQDWNEVAPGISCKLLATDPENHRVSMLVRLAPGTDYPPHRHAGVEELHLLHGELVIDDRKLYPGDYNRAGPGTVDSRVWSETGCTCVLITSTRDELR
jgi:DNA-directed RNA polymerase specialized sigma24 family protein